MPIIQVDPEKVKDNPYQPRRSYSPVKVGELASSIEQNGLLEIPLGRGQHGHYELAFGHYRKRACIKLKKKNSKKWPTMPIDIRELTDQQMAVYALEENLKRTDITPIDLARSVFQYFEIFKDATETALANKLSMTQGNISNMRRVMRLPEEILQKIDEGRITFTMARELLLFENLSAPGTERVYKKGQDGYVDVPKDSLWLMRQAIKHIATPGTSGRYYDSCPCTVEGMQKAIHGVARENFKPLGTTQEYGYFRDEILFNVEKAGCKQCESVLKTHPTKGHICYWCTKPECWEKKQEAHKAQRAAEAKKKMEADILAKARAAETERQAKAISQEIPTEQKKVAVVGTPDAGAVLAKMEQASFTTEKSGSSWIAKDESGRVIAIGDTKEGAEAGAAASFAPVATVIGPSPKDYPLNHTYRITPKPGHRKPEYESDVIAQNLATAVAALGIASEHIETVKVWKSTGKAGTGGFVQGGWGRCDEPLPTSVAAAAPIEDIIDIIPEEERESARARIRQLGKSHPNYPCLTCLAIGRCDGTGVHAVDSAEEGSELVCDEYMGKGDVEKVREKATLKVPKEILELTKEKAGSRAEILDLNELRIGNYDGLKQGYTQLDHVFDVIDNPQECLETCTKGFHFAYDSKERPSWLEKEEPKVLHVCTNPKCLAQKKAAHTRALNAVGQAKKKAEMAAIKQAIDGTTRLDKPRLKVVVYGLLNTERSYYSRDDDTTWWLGKLKVNVKDLENVYGHERSVKLREKIKKALDTLPEEELAKLTLEYCLMKMAYTGDIQQYKVQTTEALNWLGIGIQVNGKKEVS
jgi:ParB/RepB/Spo0J family partition protein